jgi:tRNA dimethylallyltransferase
VKPPIVVIAGPTASGKSALAMELALHLGGEIIGADSVQVYRGLDIGSAKPSVEDRRRVRHHLVDIRDPRRPWSAGEFLLDAEAAIQDTHSRGHAAIVCGGTGLYLRSLVHGLAPSTPSCPTTRETLFGDLAHGGPTLLHERLARVDPRSAARLPAADTVRVIRALEVFLVTGRPISEWNEEHGLGESRWDARVVAWTRPRPELHARVAVRARAMVADGLLDEVRALREDGVADESFALQTIGYRQAVDVLAGRLEEAALVEAITVATRRYVRRQLIFLRGQFPTARWFRARDAEDDRARVVEEVGAWFRGRCESPPGWASEAEALATSV